MLSCVVTVRSIRWRVFTGAVLGALMSANVALGEALLEMQDAVGNRGDTVEVSIHLSYEGDAAGQSAQGASALTLELSFDPQKLQPDAQYFEHIKRGPSGQIERDSAGNAIVARSMIREGRTLERAEKTAEPSIDSENGRITILVWGLNNNVIEPGVLLTMAFRIEQHLGGNENLMIMGLQSESSVVEPSAQNMDFTYEDAIIVTGCEGPPAPEGLAARSGLRNGVELSWQAVAGRGITYRVYRSKENDLTTALPLGDSWVDGMAFMDYTAMAADAISAFGCNRPEQAKETPYYYWVRARSGEGCPGAFSAAVTGARGVYKSAKAETPVVLGSLTGLLPLHLAPLLFACALIWRGRCRRLH